VNSGNMCFANAVLQVLVYTPPFYKLFSDLDKLLVGPVVGQKQKGTPLVDAVVSFLKEFVIEEEKKPTQTGGRGHGKGKEIDREEQEETVIDSFLPTYVYDATKENRRFDNMRVGI
jgi:ubiquitin carboxyl-terminal hydrolase 10